MLLLQTDIIHDWMKYMKKFIRVIFSKEIKARQFLHLII